MVLVIGICLLAGASIWLALLAAGAEAFIRHYSDVNPGPHV